MSTFSFLLNFIQKEMRMSHIYQPVMLMTLLRNKGYASVRDIASSILSHDESQIEYYIKITKDQPGRVLSKNRNIVKSVADGYAIIGADTFSEEETLTLMDACNRRLDEYLDKRKDDVWKHRTTDPRYISGTVRYEVLKRAKFRCELCGCPGDIRALQVDHIVPKSKGGSDTLNNYQCLCYSCNASKGARDATDFRSVSNQYLVRESHCLFCAIEANRIVDQDELSFVIQDKYPVTAHHLLVIPKRHALDYFQLFQPELNSVNRMLDFHRKRLESVDTSISGFNIGMNCGRAAGQTIMHCHWSAPLS